jgi:hypothetical protein
MAPLDVRGAVGMIVQAYCVRSFLRSDAEHATPAGGRQPLKRSRRNTRKGVLDAGRPQSQYQPREAAKNMSDPHTDGGGKNQAPAYTKRLSDKILIAFHQACDGRDLEVADQLLRVLEMVLTRQPVEAERHAQRRKQSLVAAYERLFALRNPTPPEC